MKKYLQTYQKENKLNQSELASEIGISKWSLQRFFKGLVRTEDKVYQQIVKFVNLRKLQETEIEQTNDSLLPPIPEVIGVRFENTRFANTYNYLNIGERIQVGDCVIVNSPRDGLVIVPVVAIYNKREQCNYSGSMKYIVQKVDITKHNEFVLKQRRLNELKNKLKQKIHQKIQEEIAEKYIQDDPEYKELLELGGTL